MFPGQYSVSKEVNGFSEALDLLTRLARSGITIHSARIDQCKGLDSPEVLIDLVVSDESSRSIAREVRHG